MKYLLTALTAIIGLFIVGSLWAQGSNYSYSPKDAGAYGIKIHKAGSDTSVQILVGLRKTGVDYGPFQSLQLVRLREKQAQPEVLTLPDSEGLSNSNVLADFSPAGVLWYARLMENGKLYLVRVQSSLVSKQELDLSKQVNARNLKLLKLHVIDDKEVWLVGQDGSDGIWIRLGNLNKEPIISRLSDPSNLGDIISYGQNKLLLAGSYYSNPKSKDIVTHLAITGPDLKVGKRQIRVNGLLQDLEINVSGTIAALTSKALPGNLSAYVFSKNFTNQRTIKLIKGRSFVGNASLGIYKNHLLAYMNHSGVCSMIVAQLDSSQIEKRVPMSVGADRCVGLIAHQGEKEVTLGITRWSLVGATPIVSVEVTFMPFDELLRN